MTAAPRGDVAARRHFDMITIFRAALLAVLGPLAAGAMGATPVEGRDYFRVDPAQPTSDPAKILVTEYFSYHCPHCYAFARPYAKVVRRSSFGCESRSRCGFDRTRRLGGFGAGVLRLYCHEGNARDRRRRFRGDSPAAGEVVGSSKLRGMGRGAGHRPREIRESLPFFQRADVDEARGRSVAQVADSERSLAGYRWKVLDSDCRRRPVHGPA